LRSLSLSGSLSIFLAGLDTDPDADGDSDTDSDGDGDGDPEMMTQGILPSRDMSPSFMTTSKSLRRVVLTTAAATLIAWSTAAAAQSQFKRPTPFLCLDAHEDVLEKTVGRGDELDGFMTHTQATIPNWREGGIDAVWFATWIEPRHVQGAEAITRTWEQIRLLQTLERRYSGDLKICDTAADVRQAVAMGYIAALLGIEGGVAIQNDPGLLKGYRSAGVRYMTLTWRGNLPWVGSCDPMRGESEKGLTDLGCSIVREMNRLGIVVDLSHASDLAFYDAIRVSTKPVIASHSNARALSGNSRNVTDDMLRALAKNGGVIGANFYPGYLEPGGRDWDEPGAVRVTVETLADQIDHMVRVAGIDHVGIGSDFEGIESLPMGMKSAADTGKVFETLRRRGYSDDALRKIAGENFLRVLETNEHPALDTSLGQ
jgi:membrane dipeptidase